MVNIAKRMRGLKPLLTIRNGQGAALLPSQPAPQLVHVHLISPAVTPSSTARKGARQFWRNHLRRLKYHNPTLPITVDYVNVDPKTAITLSLKFEHEDPEILRRIGGNVAARVKKANQPIVFDEISEEEKEALARQQSPNFREAPVSWNKPDEEAEAHGTAERAAMEAQSDSESTSAPDSEAEIPADLDPSALPSDEVVPSPTTSSTKGGPPLYTRSVTLGLRDRNASEIWQWFADRTRCTDVMQSEEDQKERSELRIFFKQSAIDRQRVKEGRDAVKKEKADLQRARGEADRSKEEAI